LAQTLGDLKGDMRRALATFPDQDMAHRVVDKFYIPEGKDPDKPFRTIPMWTVQPAQSLLEATILANYCEVWLAKHNDDGTPTGGIVGINRLTKVQLPTIASLYGAMLADVDYVIMGAGIPLQVPAVLDSLAENEDAVFPIDVHGMEDQYEIKFSPSDFWCTAGKPWLAERKLKRPNFVPIVSSVVLAQSMLKRASGKGPTRGIQGFVVELPTAGGHNAPPRGFRYDPVAKTHALDLNDKGEPMYGEKDEVGESISLFIQAAW
jgi:nitronate monooxygenase